jgi:uncharacterized protein (DUF1697 family)
VPRFAALIRGINVGGKKKIAMADLRDLLSTLGYTDVATLLQSGNAVFSAPRGRPDRLAKQIEDAIRAELGLDVRCLVRTAAELRAVVDADPFTGVASDGSRYLALFLSAAPDKGRLAEHDPTTLAPDHIRLGERVIYHWCPDGFLAAPDVSGFVEKRLGLTVTGRNWNTVTKLSALAAAAARAG